MIRKVTCNECNQVKTVEYICDTCGEKTIQKFFGIPITISFGYGHILDGEEYHFCSYQCLLKFIIEELKKENKNV